MLPEAEGEEMDETRLQELKTRATNLLTTARKLPPGFERQRLLVEIGKYRREISALKNSLWDQQKENDHH